ncbi:MULTISPECIES: RNA-binding protein [unclassified Leisingera]|uniref:RNA-binding protein n=1 Tax=unclassified Leisingera TaxID=2614906 RepID=UPI0002DDD23F|nr:MULTISPECIES: RNA-binding protein [unclassified Leisingera]KIC18265.1 50S ribosomal protein L7 [Leisingera sp. ANG-DT]KIC24307.1 50S ribosomal protein L7 [Leisingera sp. ANG-S3]KIC27901.1 50S ribosomal protein L7 [Leisingera sp. ANG-M6]KIC53023.1 50S ribosomal protein L7 [Leisingera sp. ANG-S]KID10077.1 50S ribosomal protein L7 [Leisingera sp. ANG1]
MTRGGTTKDRTGESERKCIATGESQPKQGLIRFVMGPDGQVVPDVMGKLPGRGVYVASSREALAAAVKKKLFARGFKAQVQVPDELVQEVERQVVRRLIELISLARKSGDAVSGFERVKDWLAKEEARVLIQASDGSGRGKSKLSTPYKGKFIGCLTADELGMAFGRQTAIHAALASGGLSKRVVDEAQRLQGLREMVGGNGRTEG